MDNILINGVAVTDANFNDSTPAASAGRANMLWSRSGSGPDQVSVQTPASVPVVLDREVTDLSVTNTTTETSVFSHSVPANAMGTNRALHLMLVADALANTTATFFILRFKFGGTTIFHDTTATIAIDADERAIFIDVWLVNQGATGDQTGGGIFMIDATGTVGSPTTGIAGDIANASTDGSAMIFADSALDTTLAQTFDVTVAWNVAGASNAFVRRMAILTLV